MKNEFHDKVVLITGGSSGIGLATAKLLSQKGAHIWLLARNREKLQSALSEVEKLRTYPDQRFGIVPADVTDASAVTNAVHEVEKACGAPDILINSAGDVYPDLFKDADINMVRLQMEINYFGTVNAIKSCLPSMITRRSGYIVIISSVYGFIGGYGYSAYCASKFAVRGFSDALRAELKPLGIGVSIVMPQNTVTPQLQRENKLKSPVMKALDTTKTMTAESVANAIIRGISQRKYVIIPGFEGKFLFWLNGIMGTGIHSIMDLMVSAARNKAGKES